MDYSKESFKILIESYGGVASAKELASSGVTRLAMYQALLNGWIIKESHGNYVLAFDQPDEYKLIQNRSDKLIFSHATALFLLGVSDRVPHELDITVPQGDNVSRFKRDYSNTKFRYCKKELWDLGIIEVKTPSGYPVKVYDEERCICDLIKDKKSVDLQIFVQSLKGYFGKRCNPRKIIKYARALNVEAKVRMYMEVLQ